MGKEGGVEPHFPVSAPPETCARALKGPRVLSRVEPCLEATVGVLAPAEAD